MSAELRPDTDVDIYWRGRREVLLFDQRVIIGHVLSGVPTGMDGSCAPLCTFLLHSRRPCSCQQTHGRLGSLCHSQLACPWIKGALAGTFPM